jgi:hypothetical protein
MQTLHSLGLPTLQLTVTEWVFNPVLQHADEMSGTQHAALLYLSGNDNFWMLSSEAHIY